MIFSRTQYDLLSLFAFQKDYPGYRSNVTELPNGDGKPDVGKKYSHIAMKYLTRDTKEDLIVGRTWNFDWFETSVFGYRGDRAELFSELKV